MKKEMLTKVLAMLLAMLCTLTLATAALAETAAEGADGDWTMEILADEGVVAEYPYHARIDLNGDGAPVLIISTTAEDFITDEDSAVVYLCADGEPKAVLEVGGGGGDRFFADLDAHILTHYSRLSGEAHIEVYRVENGALKLVTRADYYAPHHDPEQDSEESLWFQDGEAIPEAEGQALFDLYAGDDAISYEATR